MAKPVKNKLPAPPPHPPPRRLLTGSRMRWALLGLLLLTGHIIFFTWHTDRAAQSFNRSTVPPDTITGVPEPRFFLETDSYAWLAHTRDLMNSDAWRLRWTHMDNAPYGREMHWSHLLIWTIRGMATAIIAATGWPVARAIELAGVWVMPLFQFLFLTLSFLAIARKMGWLPAAGLAFAFLTFESVSIAFFPLKPDHHAFQLFFTVAAFACLQFGGMGWVRAPSASANPPPCLLGFPETPGPAEARRWFIASGVFGGLALWVGATVWLISLAIIALAVLPALPLFHPPTKEETYVPSLWRYWAGAGCAVGLICYLLEYAPAHFAMRLEVNHPLYWLSWIGVAMGLELLGNLSRPLDIGRKQMLRLLLTALVASALPLAVLLGPDAWHQMNDPFLKHLHARYITEFQPSVLIREGNWASFFATFRAYALALPGIGVLLLARREISPSRRRCLASAGLYAALFLAAALAQQRWGFSFAAALVWLTVLTLTALATASESPHRSRWQWAAAVLTLLIVLDGLHADFSRLRMENNAAENRALPESWISNNLHKRNALRWGLAADANQWRFCGAAPEVPPLYYFAGIPSVASYYWENAAGWQAEATLLGDVSPGATQALEIARTRGLTHIVSSVHSSYPEIYFYVATGIHDPVYAARHTLDGWLTYEPFTNRPAWTVPDKNLSDIGRGEYIFRIPGGYAKERLRYQVFSVHLPPNAPPEAPQ